MADASIGNGTVRKVLIRKAPHHELEARAVVLVDECQTGRQPVEDVGSRVCCKAFRLLRVEQLGHGGMRGQILGG